MEERRCEIVHLLNEIYCKTRDNLVIDTLSRLNVCNNLNDMDMLGLTDCLDLIINRYKDIGDREIRLMSNNLLKLVRVANEEITITCVCGFIIKPQDRLCDACGEETAFGVSRQDQSRTKWDNTSQHFEETLDSLEGRDRIKIDLAHENIIYDRTRDEYTDRSGNMYDISGMELSDVRRILRSLNMSGYYKNLQSIRIKIFTHFNINKDFPRFMPQERDMLKHLFEKCFFAFNEIKTDADLLESIEKDKIENIIFYPYLIRQLLPRIMSKSRAKEFDCLFISQSVDASDKHKKIWEKMLSVMNLDQTYNCVDIKYY